MVEGTAADRTLQFRVALVRQIENGVKRGETISKVISNLKLQYIELSSGESIKMCSRREAYRIWKLSRIDDLIMIPSYQTRGNRVSRYPERMKEIIKQQVENTFAIEKSRITLPVLVQNVCRLAQAEGILAKDKKVSRKFVRSVMVNEMHPDLDTNRLDPRLAKSAKAIASRRIRPGAPLNRVEIDTLHLPFIAQNEFGTQTDLHVMMAIDCETSLPLSWWLMLTKPSTDDTFSCLQRAIYPKADLLNSMDIKFSVDPYGTPLDLIFDNGSENSRLRMAAVTQVGISPQWAEVSGGHRKPFIERLNRSLKEALEGLPGCTRFNGVDGTRTTEASQEKLYTVSELERWIVRFLFEKWPNQKLERFITADYKTDEMLGITPATRWQDYENRMPLPLPPPIELWRAIQFLKIERKLNAKTGISHEGFDFKGPNLTLLINMFGPGSRVSAYYNPHDYRSIFVSSKSDEWLQLINAEVTASTPAFSFSHAKKRRGHRSDAHVTSPAAEQFDLDIATDTSSKPIGKTKSKKEQKRDAAELTKLAEAFDDAKKNPLPSSTVPSELENDSYICEDAIPTFSTYKKEAVTRGSKP